MAPVVILALTPVQRWWAAGQLNSGFASQKWLITAGLVAIGILTVMLFAVSYSRRIWGKKIARELFVDYAQRKELTEQQLQILMEVINNANLKKDESIFTLANAFDRGAAKIIENTPTYQTKEQTEQLKTNLSVLQEKLGFRKQRTSQTQTTVRKIGTSSRDIPVGKKIHITNSSVEDSSSIELIVMENDDMELTVSSQVPLENTKGQIWKASYYLGASIWEFDTSVIGCNGKIVALSHSDAVRFTNRRRFFRAAVNEPAFIANFPFKKTLLGENINPDDCWGPPQFVPATVTEIAGPGLRIEAPLQVSMSSKVLVVFSLTKPEKQNLIQNYDYTNNKKQKPEIIQAVAEVKHIEEMNTNNNFSIAVELTGLGESELNELICRTNAASITEKLKKTNISAIADIDSQRELMPELSAV